MNFGTDADLDNLLSSADEHEPPGRYYCPVLAIFLYCANIAFTCQMQLCVPSFCSSIVSFQL